MVTVRPAGAGDVAALSAALAQVFASDTVVSWLLPQRTRRTARRKQMFRLELQTYVLPQDGLVFTADAGHDGLADAGHDGLADAGHDGLAGACVALPPDQWQMPKAMDGRTAARWLWALGTRLPRSIRAQRAAEEHHPTEPHYYIRWIGVRSGLRGQGIGSALMRPILD
ncbi:MAG: GNAT family N-acetyltransferase [Catenulispora sp.]|nr:GNAT family N-acetyltransferase [Catenulispora sp.]